ncbi:hypothetical protein AALF15_01350 [Corynebacteriaceae bacterium 7-707]
MSAPNIDVEIYDPHEDTGVKQVPHLCGSFDIDAGVLVLYSDVNCAKPTAVYASGEWRRVVWR